jgi:hypothetical protein
MSGATRKPQVGERQEFPKVAPTITVFGLTFKLLHDFDRYTNGSMLMKISDTTVTFTDGKVEGQFGTAMGGTMFVQIGNRTWVMDDRDRFIRAFLEAEERQYPTIVGDVR